MELTKEQLRQVQKIELEILIELDRVCRENNINYTIIGGTLIGAVRHGGFIPWDDDVDVAMLRSDYEKFRKVCKSKLNKDKFYFQDHRNTAGYRWGYGKLRRKNTLFLRKNQEHMPYRQGICIDIFPHDGVPNFWPVRALHNFQCFCIRKILWSEVGKKADKSLLKRIWFGLLAKIPLSAVMKEYHRLIRRSSNCRYQRLRALMFPTFNKEFGYDCRWFERGADMEFEGHMFQCMKGAREYLAFSYGDYMKLPPIEQRKTHPVSKLKLVETEI